MDIKTVLEQELEGYAGEGANGVTIMTSSKDGNEFVLMVQAHIQGKPFTRVSVSVGIIGESIMIYEDRNDPPLVESLMQVGVPREQIVLAYAGEPIPVGM